MAKRSQQPLPSNIQQITNRVVAVNLGSQIPANRTGTSSDKWLTYDRYRYDNLYPQHVLELRRSSIHNSILEMKTRMIVSDGFIVPKDKTNTQLFLKNINDEYDSYELLKRSALDLATFGGFAWEIRWNILGTLIHSVKHVPFHKIRRNLPDAITGECDGFWIAAKWGIGYLSYDYIPDQYGILAKDKPYYVNEFDRTLNTRHIDKTSILYWHRYNSYNDYYPVPDYFGGIKDIETDIAISLFNANNVKTGFVPSVIIALPDNPSDEEMKLIAQELEAKYSTPTNAGRILILKGAQIGDGNNIGQAQVTPFSTTGNADIYLQVLESTRQGIITAHQLTSPSLAGIAVSGGIGIDENRTAAEYELYYNTIIKGYQREITDQMNMILSINGLYSDVQLGTMQLFSKSSLPTYGQGYMTINEQRIKAGLEPITHPDADTPTQFLPPPSPFTSTATTNESPTIV
jgi:hypothetical protein